MVLLGVGQHLSLWPTFKTLSLSLWEIVAELKTKFSNVNHFFRSFDFRDFLEKLLHFLFCISWAFQNIVQMLLDNSQFFIPDRRLDSGA